MTDAHWARWSWLLALAASLPARGADAGAGKFGHVRFLLNDKPAAVSGSVGTFVLLTSDKGPQVAMTTRPPAWVADVRTGESFRLVAAVKGLAEPFVLAADVTLLEGKRAEVELSVGKKRITKALLPGRPTRLEIHDLGADGEVELGMVTRGREGNAAVRWRNPCIRVPNRSMPIPLPLPRGGQPVIPAPALPAYRPAIEREMIEADWRMRDGIGTPREPVTYARAVEGLLRRGGALLADLRAAGVDLGSSAGQWDALRTEAKKLAAAGDRDGRWEDLWRRVHRLRRRIVFSNPLTKVGPLLFVKRVPASFSHQITQYYGRRARPGGGVFVLDAPGKSMACRQLAAKALAGGSCEHPEVSYDGRRILFAHCRMGPKHAPPRYY
ncbi:MAG TPA: hypothetical protein VM031_02130, partial [Phycisphaerae bacterium]|nr:hypothetical protein [Phycisphaerae bacterium]